MEEDLWKPGQTTTKEIVEEAVGDLLVYRCPIRNMPGGFLGLLAWRKGMVVLSALPGSKVKLLRRMAERIFPPLSRNQIIIL